MMDWINIKLQQLRQRHRAQAKQASKQRQTEAKKEPNHKAVNANEAKAKEAAAKIGKDLKAQGASKMKSVDKVSAPTNAGTKPAGSYNYQPKGLPQRGKSKGKGLSR